MSFYITTPIYYVNAEPHLGHAYTTIAADIVARHMRQRGEDVFFLTGTDEHGEPVVQAAEKAGLTPRELGDRNAPRFQEMGALVGATNDFFIRTTDPRHMKRVQEVIQRVYDNGHVYEGTYEGWYCPRCADFKTESELGPDNTCPIHKITLEREREDNWFFRLSTFQEPLERLYAERPEWVIPDFRANEALSFIRGGLRDVSLSRPKLKWGVPLPWDPEQVMYVWFDALLNYYTALSFAREGEDLTERFWPVNWHFIAKDILKFHAVYWPAFLMAAEIEVPQRELIHGYLLMEGHKMSKSLGNVLDPFEVVERFGADALRFYCFREVSFGQDGAVSAEGFEQRYETELANDWGNLASRTLAMVERYRDGVVPEGELDPALSQGQDALGGTRREGPRAARRGRADRRPRGDLVAGQAPQSICRGEPPLGSRQGRGRGGAPGFGPLQPVRGAADSRPDAAALSPRIIFPAAGRSRRGSPRTGHLRGARRRPVDRADPATVPAK